MMEFKTPEEIYREMSDEDIILIAYQPEGIKLEEIPIIQKELLHRKKEEEAIMLSEYLIAANSKANLAHLSDDELRQYINDRIQQGESIDAIRIDLKESGINIFDIIEAENKQRDEAFDFITDLKQKGYEEYEVDSKIKEKYSLQQDEVEDLHVQRNKSGRMNMVFGVVIVVVALILLPGAIEYSNRRFAGAICLVAFGVWQIYYGYQKTR